MNLLIDETAIDATPVFYANKKAYDSGAYRVIANQGSTRSSKTYSIIQLLITIADQHNKQISVCSPSLPHIKKGARKDFLEIMDTMGLFSENNFNRTDNIYYFHPNSYIEFFGVEDAGKVRGPGRDILFINEANLMDKAVYRQLALRTREVIFIDFNPADEFNYVYEVADSPGNKLIVSTYKNNRSHLSREQIAEIESYQEADENFWKVFGLGQRGTSSETIYTHWKPIDELPGKGERICGQDFGFNVPSALMEIEIYEGALYWDQLIYQSKLTTGDLIELYKNLGISYTKPIYCDSAEPKTIEELCRAGYNAMPSIKDVYVGIQKIKSMPLYITRRSVDALKEIKSYKWKKDKNDRVLDEPVKIHDHAMDAARYGTITHLNNPQPEFWAV